MVSVLVAVCFVSMTACESFWKGEKEEEKTESSDSSSDADDKDDDDQTPQLDPAKLRDITWDLKSWGKTGKETKILSGTTITLKFVDKDDLEGHGGCNNYKADYEAKTDGSMDTDDVEKTTANLCLIATANQEDEYLDNLKHVTKYEFEGDGDLRLFYEDEFMVFE